MGKICPGKGALTWKFREMLNETIGESINIPFPHAMIFI